MYEYRKLNEEQRAELVQQRLARGYPPHSPPHPVRDQPFYMLTGTCYEHAYHMLAPARRQRILDKLFEVFIEAGMEIIAWVVLPNHYHLLAHVTDFDLLGDVFRAVHGPASRDWNLEEQKPGRKVWYRYSDRAIRSERHFWTTVNYIHYNPIKHGWVTGPYDWVESSVHWYREEHGSDWLQDLWRRYPVRDYGRGWDD
jgi:putative transposase